VCDAKLKRRIQSHDEEAWGKTCKKTGKPADGIAEVRNFTAQFIRRRGRGSLTGLAAEKLNPRAAKLKRKARSLYGEVCRAPVGPQVKRQVESKR
jgi:hypothetical protein